jgi:hypothetical protein
MTKFYSIVCCFAVLFAGSFCFAGEIPYQDNSSHQELSFRNFEVRLYADNREEESHEHVDKYTGETWNHVTPAIATVFLSIEAEQGNGFGNVLPFGNWFSIEPGYNGGLIVRSDFRYIFIEDEIENWQEPPEGSIDISFREVDVYSIIRTTHREVWEWDEEAGEGQEPTVTETLDIVSSFNFGLELAKVVNSWILIDDYTLQSDDQVWRGIQIESRFEFEWDGNEGDLAGFFGTPNSPLPHTGGGGGGGSVLSRVTFAQPVPEPASASLLLMGLIGMIGFGWRRN